MPELPEVETIVNNLRAGNSSHPSIVGMRITGVEVLWNRSVAIPDLVTFKQVVTGRRIEAINRRGKYLVFNLDADNFLLIHLRMSGDLLVESQSQPISTHVRVIFNLENGMRLGFHDARKFGRVWLTKNPDDVLSALGPEPLDETLSAEAFYDRIHSRHRQLKPLLLDQSFIAGLGNIYTDEALFLAGLHPLTISDQLLFQQANQLLDSIRQVLTEGIRRNGASIDWVYRGGDFQNYFHVYQRNGEDCQRCGSLIQRAVVGQRGTHFCPKCQPEPGR